MKQNTETHAEEWRPVVGYEGIYSVSNLGRVRRDAPVLRGGGRSKPGRLLKPATNQDGYALVMLSQSGIRRFVTVHRLVAEAFCTGRTPKRSQVNHKNGKRADNRAENLEWVTLSENIRHSYRVLGRRPPAGTAHGKAKLHEGDIAAIRERVDAGETFTDTAAEFGVSRQHITRICQRKAWRHV